MTTVGMTASRYERVTVTCHIPRNGRASQRRSVSVCVYARLCTFWHVEVANAIVKNRRWTERIIYVRIIPTTHVDTNGSACRTRKTTPTSLQMKSLFVGVRQVLSQNKRYCVDKTHRQTNKQT